MGINIFNHEHYPDPTACAALTRIEQAARKTFRPCVFICSPFAGDTERNVERARRYCRFAVSSGYIPIAPHVYFPQFMDDDDQEQRDLGLFMGMVLMSRCKELWVFGSTVSRGMAVEIEKATQRGVPIRYFNTCCEEVQAV
jgi:hypothetical protein